MPIAPACALDAMRSQFSLLLAQAQGGVPVFRRDRAKQEPGYRKHQHEQLKDGEICRVVAEEDGDDGKRHLDRHQRERDAGIPFPHRHPDDRQKKQIEQIV